MDLNGAQFGDYQGQHRPTGGHGIHEADKELPDVYEHPEYYAFGTPEVDSEARAALLRARGNPDAKIPVWRAAPKEAEQSFGEGPDRFRALPLNPGDWVTTSRSYAHQHAEQVDGSKWPVYRTRVPASSIRFGGNDAVEWGYEGEGTSMLRSSPGRKRPSR